MRVALLTDVDGYGGYDLRRLALALVLARVAVLNGRNQQEQSDGVFGLGTVFTQFQLAQQVKVFQQLDSVCPAHAGERTGQVKALSERQVHDPVLRRGDVGQALV